MGGAQPRLLALAVDITDPKSVKAAVAQTVVLFGGLDVVVNNAGYGLMGSLEEVTAEEFHLSMRVNVFGTVNVIRETMPHLRQQRAGHIINFSSNAGFVGMPLAGSYNAAKFAVLGLSEALAEEVKPFNIKVTVVAPGFFRTRFLDKGSLMVTKNRIADYQLSQVEEQMQAVNGQQPGDPHKLVAALVKLVYEEHPPVHLIMGPDAYELITTKRQADLREFEQWKSVTFSTNFTS